jgi:hypothetical protein
VASFYRKECGSLQEGYMSWYRTFVKSQLLQNDQQQNVQELANLVENGIWLPLIEEKRKLSGESTNHYLQQAFIKCENAARQIMRNVGMGSIEGAAQMIRTLKNYLGQICHWIDCQLISENVSNVCILINDLLTRQGKPALS